MVRHHYGTTASNLLPPYSEFSQPGGSPQSDEHLPMHRPRPLPILKRVTRILSNRWSLMVLTFVVTLGICVTMMPITPCNNPLDPHVRERVRKEWGKELLEHERQAEEREAVKARWAWENDQHTKILDEWAQERVEHKRELKERAKREEEERARREEERAKREEEERRQLGLFWSHVEAHQCKTYGTREYTAVLMNLPANWERRMEACRATALDIHGITQMPTSCEDNGRNVVVGRWVVKQHEPDCSPYWIWYKDKESSFSLHQLYGCTSHESGKRRIEHYLENIPKGGDWREFCATTPIRFHGLEFTGAHECSPINSGAYGLWEIDDPDC